LVYRNTLWTVSYKTVLYVIAKLTKKNLTCHVQPHRSQPRLMESEGTRELSRRGFKQNHHHNIWWRVQITKDFITPLSSSYYSGSFMSSTHIHLNNLIYLPSIQSRFQVVSSYSVE
jgi:hypothetical protein